MKSLIAALKTFASFLDANQVPYMVIGGLANMQWGEPRTTFDIDITIYLEEKELQSFLVKFPADYQSLIQDPITFIAKNRVLPVKDLKNDVRIDLIFGILPFEKEAIDRARPVDINGTLIRYCTLEDLILHKIISERPKDKLDVESLVEKNRNKLDMAYLAPRVKSLAALLENPDIYKRFEALTQGKW
jgi:hypothetical protein